MLISTTRGKITPLMPSRNPYTELGLFSAARWVVPVAALLSVYGVATLQSDPAAVAESRFLGLLVAGTLAAVAAIASEQHRVAAMHRVTAILGWTALLACAASWIAYQGPSRGAVVTLILVLGLSAAIGRAWIDGGRQLTLSTVIPAAIGCQLMMRGDLLLPPLFDLRTVVSLMVLPTVAGCALNVLGTKVGPRKAFLAGGTAVVLAPGWNVTTTLALVATAAGATLADSDLPRRERALAVAVLFVTTWVNPPLGAMTVLAGLALWARGRMALVPPALGILLVLFAPSTDGLAGSWRNAASEGWLNGLVLLPAVVLVVLARDRRGMQLAAQGLIFTLLLAKAGAGADAWAAGLILVALAIPPNGAPAIVQQTWTAVLAVGSGLLATYPWMRSDPRGDLLALLDLEPLAGAIWLVALVLAGWLLERRWQIGAGIPALLVMLLIAWPLVRSGSPTEVQINSYGALTLSSEARFWKGPASARPISAVALDSNLIFSTGLAPGTPVATVKLFYAAGAPAQTWTLRAGTDTAEWAAARPDVAGLPGFAAPAHWISRLAPDGTFFSRSFRTVWRVETPHRPGYLRIERHPNLPPDVRVVIYRVELRQ